MIQMQTKLVVADNTGAKEVAMIRRLGQRTRIAHVGDIIVVAVKSSTPDAAVKKGTVAKAVVVRTKAPIRRADGSYLRFDSNAVVILEGVNIRNFHERKSQKNPDGAIVEREASIHISNVMSAGRYDSKKSKA